MGNGCKVRQHIYHICFANIETKCTTINIVIEAENSRCLLVFGSLFLLSKHEDYTSLLLFHQERPRDWPAQGATAVILSFLSWAFAWWSKSAHHSHLHTDGKVAGEWCLCPPGSQSHNMEAADLEASQTCSGCYISVGNQLRFVQTTEVLALLVPKAFPDPVCLLMLKDLKF